MNPHGCPIHYPEFSEVAIRRNVVAGPDGLLRSHHSVDRIMRLNRAIDVQGMPSIEIFSRITCPVLFIAAMCGMFNREAVMEVGESYPQLRIEWLDSSHFIQQERPAELTALITDLIASLEK